MFTLKPHSWGETFMSDSFQQSKTGQNAPKMVVDPYQPAFDVCCAFPSSSVLPDHLPILNHMSFLHSHT